MDQSTAAQVLPSGATSCVISLAPSGTVGSTTGVLDRGRLLGRRRAPAAGLTDQATLEELREAIGLAQLLLRLDARCAETRPRTPGEQLLVQQTLRVGCLDRTVEAFAGLRRPVESDKAGGPGPVDRGGIERRVVTSPRDSRVEGLEPGSGRAARSCACAR